MKMRIENLGESKRRWGCIPARGGRARASEKCRGSLSRLAEVLMKSVVIWSCFHFSNVKGFKGGCVS